MTDFETTSRPADAALHPLWTPEGRQDPYPWYARMLEDEPVAELPEVEAWGIFRYEDVIAVLRNDTDFSIERRFDRMPPEQRDVYFATGTLVGIDPPRHTRLRSLTAQGFKPSVIEAMRPYAEMISKKLLDAAIPMGRFDFLDAYATPLPQAMITEMMAIPVEDRPRYFHLTEDIEKSMSKYIGAPVTDQQLSLQVKAYNELCALFDPIFEDRRLHPRNDMITSLVEAEVEGSKLNQWELQKMAIFAYFAAFTTTQGLLSNTVLYLSQYPDQLKKLREQPRLIGNAIEEILRWRAPAPVITRMTVNEVEVGGRKIPAGSMILLFLNAANHDPRMFTDPGTFDIERRNASRHVAFAVGAHFCLGSGLARLEAQVFLKHWLERVRSWRIDVEGPLAWDPENINVLALMSLPIVVEAAA